MMTSNKKRLFAQNGIAAVLLVCLIGIPNIIPSSVHAKPVNSEEAKAVVDALKDVKEVQELEVKSKNVTDSGATKNHQERGAVLPSVKKDLDSTTGKPLIEITKVENETVAPNVEHLVDPDMPKDDPNHAAEHASTTTASPAIQTTGKSRAETEELVVVVSTTTAKPILSVHPDQPVTTAKPMTTTSAPKSDETLKETTGASRTILEDDWQSRADVEVSAESDDGGDPGAGDGSRAGELVVTPSSTVAPAPSTTTARPVVIVVSSTAKPAVEKSEVDEGSKAVELEEEEEDEESENENADMKSVTAVTKSPSTTKSPASTKKPSAITTKIPLSTHKPTGKSRVVILATTTTTTMSPSTTTKVVIKEDMSKDELKKDGESRAEAIASDGDDENGESGSRSSAAAAADAGDYYDSGEDY